MEVWHCRGSGGISIIIFLLEFSVSDDLSTILMPIVMYIAPHYLPIITRDILKGVLICEAALYLSANILSKSPELIW